MGIEIDLMRAYPRTSRDVNRRGNEKTEEDRRIARKFSEEFFDGGRRTGYGGFHYHPRFWQPVIPAFQKHFGLSGSDTVLDVGCAKGFMIYDFMQMIPGIAAKGLDISQYAISNCIEDVRDHVQVGDVRALPYDDNSFDLIISITTLHNCDRDGCIEGLREIERVSRGRSFITVDAYQNDEEQMAAEAWNLTAKTILHVSEWKRVFSEAGYTGDYYWFIP